jgi:hypothetical protein
LVRATTNDAWAEAVPGAHFQAVERPEVAARVQEVIGLYVDPPEHASVVSVDEKSQIQTLDRTQPDRRCFCAKSHCYCPSYVWASASAVGFAGIGHRRELLQTRPCRPSRTIK